jgi:hypothetical protein
MSDQSEVSTGVAMTPAMHVAPTAVTINVTPQHAPDGSKFLLLHIEHGTGSTMVCLSPEFAGEVARSLIEQSVGLTIATPLEVVRHTGF